MSKTKILKKIVKNLIDKSIKENKITSPNNVKETIHDIENQCLELFNDMSASDVNSIVDKVVDVVITMDAPKIILEHYLIILRIKQFYHGSYSNGFFNKLFMEFYMKFPQTIVSLFIELPNYQFFYYFLIYLLENNIKYTDKNGYEYSLLKMYNFIILLFSSQLSRDYEKIKDATKSTNEEPFISNVALLLPYNDLYTKELKKIQRDLAQKLFDDSENQIKKLKDVIEILRFNITVIQKKNPNYIFEHDIEFKVASHCCFKIFRKNFIIEIQKLKK